MGSHAEKVCGGKGRKKAKEAKFLKRTKKI
jgi:hypothetical protein